MSDTKAFVRTYKSFSSLQKQSPSKAKDIIKIYKQVCDTDDALVRQIGLKEQPTDEAGMVQFLTNRLSSRGGTIYTIEIDDKVIGIGVVITAEFKDSVFLSILGMDASYRGQGYGRALLEYIVDVHKQQKQTMLVRVISSNKAAVHLYEACGFKTELSKVLVCK